MKTIGTNQADNKCSFRVWAPEKDSMILHLVHPKDEKIEMQKDELGYYCAEVEDIQPGTLYFYSPDAENDYPDPGSNYQPKGVHGPSEIVDHSSYKWNDIKWRGLPFKDLILYELHVGTYTKEGTFEAIIPKLDTLVELGVNAIELMPVSQFPGNRNWGYDGVYPYAVQNSYGGPDGLKKLVDACHQKGIAVFLDVVYNHLGPEGNYFSNFGPYFTDKYKTPWGDALNFDGDWSDGVREYFSNNVLYWFDLYHIDGLRCDAIHMVFDTGAINFWELTYNKVKLLEQKVGRPLYMIAESDLNSPRVITKAELGGYGFDAQWLDDFHHALYVLLDKNGKERYEDFGQLEQLAKAYTDGFVHSGEFVKFRKRKHGSSSAGIAGDKFVVFNQNHDQVGNRVMGERLCMLVDFERQKIASAAILLAPYVPMLFMGEEYSDESPFFYFVSHSDEQLIKAVQEGRKKEFESYNGDAEPPDPQSEDTFEKSKLRWEVSGKGRHKTMFEWHKKLIEIRRTFEGLTNFNKNDVRINVISNKGFAMHRKSEDGLQTALCLFNLSDEPIDFTFPNEEVEWIKQLDSKENQWLEDKNSQIQVLPKEAGSNATVTLLGCSVTVYSSVK